ncbi:hypothetical protein NT05HA_0229 [Aggregatibacter aphrophilus NJ8700]|nr:hypothetical protein NT05HA_0229 [Aggregatibacter aphrophilus NJ8700]
MLVSKYSVYRQMKDKKIPEIIYKEIYISFGGIGIATTKNVVKNYRTFLLSYS